MANDNSNNKQGGTVKKIVLIFILLVIVGLGAWYGISNWERGNEAKAGVLIQFGQRGLAIKTYEGQLNIGGMNTVPSTAQANQIWNFSVRDKAVAEQLMGMTGRKVSLHYIEVVNSMPWQGQTNYFVDKVELLP